MIAFIDDHRADYGVEPICRILPIAPSTFHAADARRHRPDTAPPRVRRDAELKPEILRVFNENFGVYGVCKVWGQMRREGFDVAAHVFYHGAQPDFEHVVELQEYFVERLAVLRFFDHAGF